MTTSLVAATLWFLGTALTLSDEARTGPILVAVPVVLLLLSLLYHDVRRPSSLDEVHSTAASRPLVWALALPVLTTVAGMLAGPVLFIVAWLQLRGGARPAVALAAGAITGVALWLLLMLGLGGMPGAAVFPFWLS